MGRDAEVWRRFLSQGPNLRLFAASGQRTGIVRVRRGGRWQLNRRILAVLLVAAWAAGCAKDLVVPAGGASGPPPADVADAAWARVLTRHVDAEGRIDFAGIARDPADLDAFVAYVATVSPSLKPAAFPTKGSAIAWYINAYNALAMYVVIQSGMPPDLDPIRVRFFSETRMLVGGRRISLDDLENDFIRPLGEARVHFALNSMTRGGPRLPREPFRTEELGRQLEAAAQGFLTEKRNVDLDAEKRIAWVSMTLNWYEADFLKNASSLAAYINRYRITAPIPAGWQIRFIPYDWKLNAQ
jgi:hypothetical protein